MVLVLSYIFHTNLVLPGTGGAINSISTSVVSPGFVGFTEVVGCVSVKQFRILVDVMLATLVAWILLLVHLK